MASEDYLPYLNGPFAGLAPLVKETAPLWHAKKSNLDRWARYSKDTSFDQSVSKRQSKKDLAPCGHHGRENDYSDDMKIADTTDQGDGWEHYSDLSPTNSYTGKGGSKRD